MTRVFNDPNLFLKFTASAGRFLDDSELWVVIEVRSGFQQKEDAE